MNRSYVLQAFQETPWAIIPSRLAIIEEIVMRHVSGEKLNAEEIQARVNGAAPAQQSQVRNVAVLPLFGVIFPRANMVNDISGPGGTSAERFGQNFDKLIVDPNIDAIVIDINSPGGQVGGIQEVSQKIFNARGSKPIIAVANPLTASAAYWIGTAADELVVTPSGEVGSIGVFAVHEDISQALAQEGVKMSIISAGKYKVEANQYEPLSEEAYAAIQADVNIYYDAFVNDIARNRGVSPDAVRNGFGEGRVVSADQAVQLGMADRVGTLDETINRLLNVDGIDQKNHMVGQVPDHVKTQSQLTQARARLAAENAKVYTGAKIMNIREMLKERAALLAHATQLVETADQENRDFTEAEREEYQALLGKDETDTGTIGALDAKIEQMQGEREKLRVAAERNFSVTKVEKPEPGKVNSLKMAEFRKLDPNAQMAFLKGGGKLED